MARLFQPLQIGSLELPNRIVIPPMCQYSADGEGNATDWHMMHMPSMALSGAGLFIIEATAVEPAGRITPTDLGLWSDANEQALARVLQAVRRYSGMPLAIQLAHAGRKASCHLPWDGGQQIPPGQMPGWRTVAPSEIPFAPHEAAPQALDHAGLARVRDAFAQAAARAGRLGLDGVELHFAHGYLMHQFLSPLSNRRDDAYGGSLANRMRFPLEVFEAVRAAFPAERPVWVRVSATEWVEGGWDVPDTVAFLKELQARGCAAVDVSSGGNSMQQKLVPGPGYQVPLAARVKAETGMTVMAVGLITEPEQAETILMSGQADAVGVARGMLYNPRWPWQAAAKLGAQADAAPQYLRAVPFGYKNLFKAPKPQQR